MFYDIEIARVESIINQKKESMTLNFNSLNNRAYIEDKVVVDNYKTYRIRLIQIKRSLQRRLKQIIGNYEGDSGKLMYAYFIEDKTTEEIAKEFNLNERVVIEIIAAKEIELNRMQ